MELRLPLEMSPGREAACRAVFGTWRFFPTDARKNCPFVLTSFTGWSSERCPGIGFLSRGDREIGVLWNVEPPTRPRLECLRETGLILRCDRKVGRSEEHTSELQSPKDLVCRLLLEKKKKNSQKEPQSHRTAGRRRVTATDGVQ